MATATERIPILVTRADKAKFVRKAKTHGLSISEVCPRRNEQLRRLLQGRRRGDGAPDQAASGRHPRGRAIPGCGARILCRIQRAAGEDRQLDARTRLPAMSWSERAWEAFREVLRLQDKVNSVGVNSRSSKARNESLTIEVAELRMAMVMLMGERGIKEWPRLAGEPRPSGVRQRGSSRNRAALRPLRRTLLNST